MTRSGSALVGKTPAGAARLFRIGLGVAMLVFVLDQITKWWIVEVVMQPPRSIPVTPFFNLVMGWNRGVSFGMLSDVNSWTVWVLPIVVVVITAVLLVWLWRSERTWPAVALGLVIGGALGNLLDRLRFGAVADFLDFHVAGYHWPAFNIADSGITVGAVMLVIDALFGPREHPKSKTDKHASET